MSVTRRQRKIPPVMFDDETLMELTTEQRLTGLGLYFIADDHGRGSATPARVRSDLWPLSETITNDSIVEHLEWLDQAGLIQLYEAEGRTYFVILDWPSQDHPTASKIPPPPPRQTHTSASRSPLEVLGVEEREERGGEGARGREGAQGESADASAPDPTSPFCPKHRRVPTLGNCGPCGTARRFHADWLKKQTDTAAADLDGPAA
jgi:hypothetical protein